MGYLIFSLASGKSVDQDLSPDFCLAQGTVVRGNFNTSHFPAFVKPELLNLVQGGFIIAHCLDGSLLSSACWLLQLCLDKSCE